MDIDYYQHSFNASDAAILVIDGSDSILAANPAFLDLFNSLSLTSQDFIGKCVFSHPVLIENNLCNVYKQLLNAEGDKRKIVVMPQEENNTSSYEVYLQSFAASDTQSSINIIFHDDVTDLVKAHESAKQAQDMLDEIQEATNFGWWDLDIQSQSAVWSKQLFYLLGYDPDTEHAESEKFLDRIHPEDREKAIAALEQPFEDHSAYSSEFRLLLPDGKIRHVTEHGKVLFDEHGKGLRYLGTTLDMTDRVEAEQKLRDSELELRKILENMQDTYYRTDADDRLVRASASIEQLLGYKPDEVLGIKMTDFYADPSERDHLLKKLQRKNSSVQGFEVALKHKNGSIVWVSTNAQVLSDDDGNLTGTEGTTRNINDKKVIEIQMKKLSQALEQSADSVTITDAMGNVEYVNTAFEKTTGYSYKEAVGNKPSILKSGEMTSDFYQRLWKEITRGVAFSDLFVNRKKDGSLFYEQKTITPLKNDRGEITNYVSTGKDVTDYIQSQKHIKFLAHHDALTKLPNRVLFQERLEHAVKRAKRHNSLLTVMFLDLDRFKVINDTLGHHFGDQLLKDVSKRLRECVREEDTIARLGGDEFSILIEEQMSISDISTLANKLLDIVALPYYVFERELHISTSIGISSFPHDGKNPDLLLSNADAAMYKAKEIGRNNYAFYSLELSEKALDRLKIENALRYALDRNEFSLFYQPQMNIHTGKVSGMEALIRWESPEFGMVNPVDFIFVLEEIGLINSIGKWVIQESCRQLKSWHVAGYSELSMSINLSSRQFNDPSVIDVVKQALKTHQLEPHLIDLEITESLLMRNVKSVDEILNKLSGLGVNIAIDDFGTGYSSLSYLKRFPIDILKIDQSFIKDIVFDDESSDEIEIVKAIIAMGKVLHMQTIAEGVENEEQKVFLTENGCDLIQGYWLSKPLTVKEMSQWLSEH